VGDAGSWRIRFLGERILRHLGFEDLLQIGQDLACEWVIRPLQQAQIVRVDPNRILPSDRGQPSLIDVGENLFESLYVIDPVDEQALPLFHTDSKNRV
jgi:hypothetical protein